MKIYLLFLMLCSLSAAYGQQAILSADECRTLYLGMSNPMSFNIEGFSCEAAEIKVSNGKIYSRQGCRLIYQADSIGKADFSIYLKTKTSKRLLAKFQFRVEKVSLKLLSKLGSSSGGPITKMGIAAHSGIRIQIDWTGMGIGCLEGITANVSSYNILVVRESRVLFYTENSTAYFTAETLEVFKDLHKGDKVYFINIIANAPGGTAHSPEMEFVVID
jgi:hypothetical protein